MGPAGPPARPHCPGRLTSRQGPTTGVRALQRVDWTDLDPAARDLIEGHTGPVLAAETAAEGHNSQIAAVLHTAGVGKVFVKGLRLDVRGVVTQHREAVVNPWVRPLSPALLWAAEDAGWSLLGFEHAPGRHADYRPGSPDIPLVVDAMARLARLRCPDLPQLKRAEQRWAAHVDDEAKLGLLAGDTLLHTDYNPYNVLVDGRSARLIDWAWPTKGAAFIDPASLVVRLVFAGHTPTQAEAVVGALPAWRDALPDAVNAFADAVTHMWAEIVDADPTPWKRKALGAATAWRTHRRLRS